MIKNIIDAFKTTLSKYHEVIDIEVLFKYSDYLECSKENSKPNKLIIKTKEIDFDISLLVDNKHCIKEPNDYLKTAIGKKDCLFVFDLINKEVSKYIYNQTSRIPVLFKFIELRTFDTLSLNISSEMKSYEQEIYDWMIMEVFL